MNKQDIKLKLKDINIEEVLERDVSDFGTGAHIIVPQKHTGKKSIVIIKEGEKK